MQRMMKWAILLLALWTVAPAMAQSGRMTWRFEKQVSATVDVEFFSRARNHVWPGKGKVWVIRDYKVHYYDLQCRVGEKICYGAYIRNNRNSFWGIGYMGRQSCQRCCYVCTRDLITPIITLQSRR